MVNVYTWYTRYTYYTRYTRYTIKQRDLRDNLSRHCSGSELPCCIDTHKQSVLTYVSPDPLLDRVLITVGLSLLYLLLALAPQN